MLLTRSPLVYPRKGLTARLACVKHAASVRPEPGSNSPLKSICKPQPQKQGAAENKQQKNDPMQTETNQTDLNPEKSQRNPTRINDDQTNQPRRGQPTQTPKPVNGKILNFGIDFRHAVEFSRIGRTPRFRLSFEAPGQPAKHYCFVRGQSNRPLSSQSLCVSQ